MTNSIAYAKYFTNILDEVHQRTSVSECLTSPRRMAKTGAHTREIMILKISVTDLGNYVHNVSYTTGSIEFSYGSHSPSYDYAEKNVQPRNLHTRSAEDNSSA